MKNNKKTIMIVSIMMGVLVLTIGLTYSIFTISKTGSNSKLVVGDVYMHYKETTNSINLTNQMPLAEKYIVNPNMANQTYQDDTRNELSKCVDYYLEYGETFDEGNTAETYCKGEGTQYGNKFEHKLTWSSPSQELLNSGVVIEEDAITISNYDACGSDVVIPKTINNKRVFKVELGAFRNKQLTNVKLLEGLIVINYEAFTTNNIVSVEIPDSVIYLSCGAFDGNVSITKNSNLKCEQVIL